MFRYIDVSQLLSAQKFLSMDVFCIQDLIKPSHQKELVDSLPEEQFRLLRTGDPQDNGDIVEEVSCHVLFCTLFNEQNNVNKLKTLNKAWNACIRELCSDTYTDMLSRLTHVDLTSTYRIIDSTIFHANHYVDTHYDKQRNKVLTQVFYVNDIWQNTWGGYLKVFVRDQLSPVVLIPPVIKYSVIFLPTQKAWHEILMVKKGVRQTIILQYFKK